MLKVKEGVNIDEICSGGRWIDTGTEYEIDDLEMEECISINKESRILIHSGFNALILDLVHKGYIESV